MNMTTSSFSWAFISLFQDGIELTESLKGKRQLSTTVSKEDYASILQLCMPVSVQGCVCKILSVCVCLIVKRPSAILIVYVFILGYITRFFRKTEMNMLHNFRFTFLYPLWSKVEQIMKTISWVIQVDVFQRPCNMVLGMFLYIRLVGKVEYII